MLLSFFQLSLAIRNVWPKRMSLKAFIVLYMLLLLAGMPVTLLSCIPYGLFGILWQFVFMDWPPAGILHPRMSAWE